MIKVMIADDQELIRQSLQIVLSTHEDLKIVDAVENGFAVLESIKKERPDVILMDEPTSALDPISTLRVEELVQELKENYSIIMVTHNMQQAARVSDKTAFFLNGYVNEYDDTDKIFSNPADKQTEDYISGRFG